MTLSDRNISIIKSTVPVLQTRGTDIILVFYDTLFERYPAVKPYFNT